MTIPKEIKVLMFVMIFGFLIFSYLGYKEQQKEDLKQGELVTCYDRFKNEIKGAVCVYESNPNVFMAIILSGMMVTGMISIFLIVIIFNCNWRKKEDKENE